MKKYGPRYHLKTRRHRSGRTDYRRRLRLLRSRQTRLVIRRSLKQIQVQFIAYNSDGDQIITAAMSKELPQKYKWNGSTSSTPAAYLTGILAGKKAQEKGIQACILDIGRYPATKGSKLFAAMKGVVDAGITCPYDESILPPEDRLLGKHIKDDLSPQVEKIKNKILGDS